MRAFTEETVAGEGRADEPLPARSTGSWQGFPWAITGLIAAITVYGSIFFYTVSIQASSGLVALGLSSPARIGLLTSIASLGVPLGTLLYSRIGGAHVRALLLAEFVMLAPGFGLVGCSCSVDGFPIGSSVTRRGGGLRWPRTWDGGAVEGAGRMQW